jgi:CheY-like chemotaxis protein
MEFAPTDPSRRGQPQRVLCAEDHPQMAELMTKVLRQAGHSVVCVPDGRQALQLCDADRFDVVVTDHQMPNVSGLELVAQLRAKSFGGKIVVHTSRINPIEEAAYRAHAVTEILMKPGGILKLAQVVSR